MKTKDKSFVALFWPTLYMPLKEAQGVIIYKHNNYYNEIITIFTAKLLTIIKIPFT